MRGTVRQWGDPDGPPNKGPAFTDGKEAFLRGRRFDQIPPFYAGNGQREIWELGWRVGEKLRKEKPR